MIKAHIYGFVWMVIGLAYSISAVAITINDEHLSELQMLIKHNLAYNRKVSHDSIIAWEKQLSPVLEAKKEYNTLFQLKLMVVDAYSVRGDISMSVNYARKMYQKAQSMKHELGIALSYQAIGEAYLNTNMPEEAIESYEKSLQLLNENKNARIDKEKLLVRLAMTLIKVGDMAKAARCLKSLDEASAKNPSGVSRFFVQLSHAYYFMRNGETDQARACLTEAEKYSKQANEIYYCDFIDYLLAQYYQVTGEYEQALELYEKIQSAGASSKVSIRMIQLYKEQAWLLTRMGRMDEACLFYQQSNEKVDSLNAASYIRQVSELRTTYQIDQLEIENQKLWNQIILWTIVSVFIVLILVALLFLRILRENKRLLYSEARLEEAKKYAEVSTRAKSIFLSNMSHEIRTPLNALSGFSEILADEAIDNETRKQCNDIIQQNSELLLNLINDVIDISSLEVGKLAFNLKTCDAVTLCRNVVDTIEKVKQTQASIMFVTSLDSLELLTDSSRLQQVLINLLVNATKFTPEGAITLELSKESETIARFSVTDTGCGIPLEKQSKIFNRFEKLDEGAQGTGLGLSICQFIIEGIGGEIGVDPEYTQGSRFVFTHPIHPVTEKEDMI